MRGGASWLRLMRFSFSTASVFRTYAMFMAGLHLHAQTCPAKSVQQWCCLHMPALPADSEKRHTLTNRFAVHSR
eukprot:6604295-Alexandrium_andersonii.AAC.1